MLKSLFVISSVLIVLGCGEPAPKPMTQKEIDARLVEINKEMMANESARINFYIDKHGLDVTDTGTGLRYSIYESGEGELAKSDQEALVHFTITLLDGTKCYTSRDGDPRSFRIGASDVESGLHEGITYMRPGDRALLILPSHLAHGLIGDAKEIPPKSTIVYDIELLAVR